MSKRKKRILDWAQEKALYTFFIILLYFAIKPDIDHTVKAHEISAQSPKTKKETKAKAVKAKQPDVIIDTIIDNGKIKFVKRAAKKGETKSEIKQEKKKETAPANQAMVQLKQAKKPMVKAEAKKDVKVAKTQAQAAKPEKKWNYIVDGKAVKDLSSVKFEKKPSARLKEKVYKVYQTMIEDGKVDDFFRKQSLYAEEINSLAREFNIDPDFFRAWIYVESVYDKNAVGPNGEKGLLQIYNVPENCSKQARAYLGVKELNVFDPKHNMTLGAITLLDYQKQMKNDLLLGLIAFNWGPNNLTLQRAENYASIFDKVPNKIAKNYPLQILSLTLMQKVKAENGSVLSYKEYPKSIENIQLPGIDS